MLMWFNPLGLCPAGKGFNRFNIRSGFLRSCVPLKKERVFQRSSRSSGNALCAYSKFKLADASAVALALHPPTLTLIELFGHSPSLELVQKPLRPAW